MYFYLSFKSSQKLHPENTMADFTSEIFPPIYFQGNYEVALVEMRWNKTTVVAEDLYVFCDLADSKNYVNSQPAPILAIVDEQGKINKPFYTPITRDFIQRIRIYSTDVNGKPPKIDAEDVRCTLHIRSAK